jgi:peptidoglycan/xylan/chitin deacetylase (PgdA/CDA1 family)
MLLPILIAAGGVAVLTHVAPFPFLLDLIHGRSSVWRVPVDGTGKPIYLTFDDGPNPTATPGLLDALKEKDVRATFFVIDDHVNEATAPIVKRMFEEGHCVAQHTGRRWLLLRSPSHVHQMLSSAALKVERLTGRKPERLFRPHAGWRSESLFQGARRAGYKVVGWSWRGWDWSGFRERTGPRVANKLIARASPGAIFVIHDGHHRNPLADRAYAIDATRRIVDALRPAGYSFETLCEADLR